MTSKNSFWVRDEFNRDNPAPLPPRDGTFDRYHGKKVADPFRPLEDLDAPATAAWVAAQNERFQTLIDGVPSIDAVKKFMNRALFYRKETLPSRYGDHWFYMVKDGLAPQYDVMIADSEDGKNARVFIDANKMSADGTVALSGYYPSPDGKLVAYTVAEAGSDALTMRIRDVATGKDLPDEIPNLRFTGASWDRESSKGFIYAVLANDGKRRFETMHHTVGAKIADDKLVFTYDREDAFTSVSHLQEGTREWGNVQIGTLPSNGVWVRDEGSNKPFRKLFDEGVASYSIAAEVGDTIYMVTNHDAPRGKLVSFNINNPAPSAWKTIIPEHAVDVLEWVTPRQGVLLAGISHDAADKLSVYAMDGTHLHDAPIPLQSTFGFARIRKEDKSALMSIANFQQPGSRYRYDFVNNKLDFVKASPAPETLTDCIVERIHAVSKDGTKVPMTVVRHPDTKLDGSAATMLYGYGGFNVPLGPSYGTSIASWVRAGGIYVQANLRGGGEFGRDWYDQGRKLNKQNVFDDFAACAQTLIDGKYTSAKRLVIEGGSNGGLLTLATMLQKPKLFGAVISSVPVTDMYRFHKHTHGAAWMSDYGDIEKVKEDFEAASKYSPLHNVKKGRHYPPTLVVTGDHDDRVVPSHAYKFVATMQEKSHPDNICVLRVETRAGHGAGKPTDKMVQEQADIHAFIESVIGPINQRDYLLLSRERRVNGAGNLDDYKAALKALAKSKPAP